MITIVEYILAGVTLVAIGFIAYIVVQLAFSPEGAAWFAKPLTEATIKDALIAMAIVAVPHVILSKGD